MVIPCRVDGRALLRLGAKPRCLLITAFGVMGFAHPTRYLSIQGSRG